MIAPMAAPRPPPNTPPMIAPVAPPTIAPPTGSCAAASCIGIARAMARKAEIPTARIIPITPLSNSHPPSRCGQTEAGNTAGRGLPPAGARAMPQCHPWPWRRLLEEGLECPVACWADPADARSTPSGTLRRGQTPTESSWMRRHCDGPPRRVCPSGHSGVARGQKTSGVGM